MRVTLAERFWAKVVKTDGCWEWTACRSQSGSGYGMLGIGKYRRVQAHRLSWEMANGRALRTDEIVMHSCDNKACVRPDHLSVGDQSRNILDMVRKGRCYNAKLSDADVLAIRASREPSPNLATRFGVCAAHIRKVRRGISKASVS